MTIKVSRMPNDDMLEYYRAAERTWVIGGKEIATERDISVKGCLYLTDEEFARLADYDSKIRGQDGDEASAPSESLDALIRGYIRQTWREIYDAQGERQNAEYKRRKAEESLVIVNGIKGCLLYTSPSPRD